MLDLKGLDEIINKLGFEIIPTNVAGWIKEVRIFCDAKKVEQLKRFFELLESFPHNILSKVGIYEGDIIEDIMKRNGMPINDMNIGSNELEFSLYSGWVCVGKATFKWRDRKCEINTHYRYRRGVGDSFGTFLRLDWEKAVKGIEDVIKRINERIDLLMSTNLGFEFFMNGFTEEKQRCYLSIDIGSTLGQIIRINETKLKDFFERETKQLNDVRDFIDQILNFFKEVKELKEKNN